MAEAQLLHKIAIGLILIAVVCFLLVPVLGMTLIFVGLAIETIGYFVWGADFWGRRQPRARSTRTLGGNFEPSVECQPCRPSLFSTSRKKTGVGSLKSLNFLVF